MSWYGLGGWLGWRTRTPILGEIPVEAPPGKIPFVVLMVMLAAIWAAERVAWALLPTLVRDHPLILIALDSRTHNLLLASGKLGFAEFVVVAVAWRFGVHWLYYLLGRWYGDTALRWLTRKSKRRARLAQRVERSLGRFAGPMVLLLSNKLICVLAGSAGMRPIWFVGLHLPGSLLRIIVLRRFAQTGDKQLDWVIGPMDRQADWLTLLFTATTILTVVVTAVGYRNRAPGESKAGRPEADAVDEES